MREAFFKSKNINSKKLLQRIITGQRQNISFKDVQKLLDDMGFSLARISGSHHIYIHENIPQAINLQEVKGQAKPYQLRQILKIIEQYNIEL